MHDLPDVLELVIEELIRLHDARAQLLEGLLQPLDLLLALICKLPCDFFIQGAEGVINVLVGDARAQELLAVLDAPERL